ATEQPSAASCSATPRPRPRPAPVTRMTGVAFTTHQLTPKAPPARGFFRRIPAFFRLRLCTFFPRIRPPSIPPPRSAQHFLLLESAPAPDNEFPLEHSVAFGKGTQGATWRSSPRWGSAWPDLWRAPRYRPPTPPRRPRGPPPPPPPARRPRR